MRFRYQGRDRNSGKWTGVPYIGVHGVVVTEKLAGEQGTRKGIYVREVEADSPAMQAGIQNGDVITEINKRQISPV